MAKLVAQFSGRSSHLTELRYAGRMLKAGDEFEASEKDARILKAIGKAANAPAAVVKPPAKRAAASPVGAEVDTDMTGRYQRRDMRAQE